MNWVEWTVLAVAAVLIWVFWRVMSRIEYRESLDGRGVVGASVSATVEGTTVSVIVTNTTRKAADFGVFAVVLTEQGWFESTRRNNPVRTRLNPGETHTSTWDFPDASPAIAQIDVQVHAPDQPYRIALRALTPTSTRETVLA